MKRLSKEQKLYVATYERAKWRVNSYANYFLMNDEMLAIYHAILEKSYQECVSAGLERVPCKRYGTKWVVRELATI